MYISKDQKNHLNIFIHFTFSEKVQMIFSIQNNAYSLSVQFKKFRMTFENFWFEEHLIYIYSFIECIHIIKGTLNEIILFFTKM